MSEEELSKAEQARQARRDRRARARHQALMRTGLSKQFHTLNEIIARAATDPEAARKRRKKPKR